MFWPDSTSRTASCLNSIVYRARVAFVIFIPLLILNHSANEYVFRGQGQFVGECRPPARSPQCSSTFTAPVVRSIHAIFPV
jgi:hypothetical protein